MKKMLLLLGCFIILGTTVTASEILSPERTSVNVKVGLGTGSADYGRDDYNFDISLANTSVNIEYIASYERKVELGAGVGMARNAVDDWDWDITTIPVYALARYKWDTASDWNPYVFSNLGYAFSNYDKSYNDNSVYDNEKINGGLYWALGVGAEYKENFSAELYWNRYDLEYERNSSYGDEKGDFDVDMVTLAFGYRLDI